MTGRAIARLRARPRDIDYLYQRFSTLVRNEAYHFRNQQIRTRSNWRPLFYPGLVAHGFLVIREGLACLIHNAEIQIVDATKNGVPSSTLREVVLPPFWPHDTVVSRKVHDLAVHLGVSAAKAVVFFLDALCHFCPRCHESEQHWYFYQETATRLRTPSLTFNRYIGSEVSARPEAEPKETFNGKTPSSSCDVVPCDTSSCSIPASEQPNISPYPCKTIRRRIFPCQEYRHVCVPEEPAERGPTAEG